MGKRDKLFLISLLISIFSAAGIAGNMDYNLPVPKGIVIIYLIPTAYCIGRIIYFDLYESKEE